MRLATVAFANSLRYLAVALVSGAALVPASRADCPIDLSGQWAGNWRSCTSGHSGPLKATVCKCDETHYQVRFRGRFFGVIPFRYEVTLEVVGQDKDRVFLSGEAYLGHLFGTFHYQAEATDCEFRATYTSCRDNGTFCLTRTCH
jgi:hypothetical protein